MFVSAKIKKQVAMGAVRVWGKVGRDGSAYLVLPLQGEAGGIKAQALFGC